jgi:DNA-binding MarR family transcriptional regulator
MRQRAASDDARHFGELFPAVYLRFHRRDGKRRELSGASRAVLHHLTLSGPLTIGEMARHLSRAQSVISEIVDHLERDGLLERIRDPKDRRRTLVWLSERGLVALDREREVLSSELLTRAMTRMKPAARLVLLSGMQALLAAQRGDSNRKRRA